jgi:Na+(H+)/acetate symporter ActP
MSPAAGRRVEAKEITGLAHLLPEVSPAATKTGFFLVAFLIPVYFTWEGLRGSLWFWLAATAFLSLATLASVKLNVIKLHWLVSELCEPVKFSYSTHQDRNYPPTGEYPFDVQQIAPGDLICTSGKHARLVDSYEQQPEQWNKRNLIECYDLVLISASEPGRTVLGILGEAELRYRVPGKDEYFART